MKWTRLGLPEPNTLPITILGELKRRIEDSTKGLRIAKLNETQFGFRPKLGTEPQILKMLYECNQEKENN